MKLASVVHADGLRKSTQLQFGGYMALGTEGQMCDMENLTSDYYPELASRPQRLHAFSAMTPQGMQASDHLFTVFNDVLVYYDTDMNATAVNLKELGVERTFAVIGDYLTIWPDKLALDLVTGELTELGHTALFVTGYVMSMTGTYSSVKNCIYVLKSDKAFDEDFHAGDALTISGCNVYPENNKTIVLREIVEYSNHWRLYFDDYALEWPNHQRLILSETILGGDYYADVGASDYAVIIRSVPAAGSGESIYVRLDPDISASYTFDDITKIYSVTGDRWLEFEQAPLGLTQADLDEDYPDVTMLPFTMRRSRKNKVGFSWAEDMTIARVIPDLENVFQHDNRLMGTVEDTIRISRWGDPFNWDYYDGTSADSFATETGTPGEFTGAISYGGYPRFFKESYIFTLYGDYPAEYQLVTNRSLGVMPGSAGSLAIGDGCLFYLSIHGPCMYAGGEPTLLSDPFGTDRYHDGEGASDDKKYYLNMLDENEDPHLFVYDIRKGLWMREEGADTVAMCCWFGDIFRMASSGSVDILGRAVWTPAGAEDEDQIEWYAEFGDIAYGLPERTRITKLSVRLEMEENTAVKVLLKFDSEPKWRPAAQVAAPVKRSALVPIIPRRTDYFRIRLEGTGSCRISSMSIETATGSDRN